MNQLVFFFRNDKRLDSIKKKKRRKKRKELLLIRERNILWYSTRNGTNSGFFFQGTYRTLLPRTKRPPRSGTHCNVACKGSSAAAAASGRGGGSTAAAAAAWAARARFPQSVHAQTVVARHAVRTFGTLEIVSASSTSRHQHARTYLQSVPVHLSPAAVSPSTDDPRAQRWPGWRSGALYSRYAEGAPRKQSQQQVTRSRPSKCI